MFCRTKMRARVQLMTPNWFLGTWTLDPSKSGPYYLVAQVP